MSTQPLPRVFWVLWAGTAINRAATFVLPLLVPFLTQDRAFSASAAGVIVAIHGCGMIVGNFAGGQLADLVGRKRTMVSGLCLAAAFLAVLLYVRSPVPTGIVVLGLGVVGEVARPAAQALVVDVVGRDARVRAFGLLSWASNLGIPVGMTVTTVLLPLTSFEAVFAIDACGTLVFSAILAAGLPSEPPWRRGAISSSPKPPAWAPARDPRLLLLLTCTFGGFVLFFQSWVALPLAVEHSGLGPATFTLLLALNGVAVAVIQPASVAWLERRRAVPLLAAAYAATGLAVAMCGLAGSLVWFGACVIIWSAAEVVVGTLEPALVAGVAPRDQGGAYMGTYGAALSAGLVAAPLVGAPVFEHSPEMFAVGAVVIGTMVAALQGFGGHALGIGAAIPSNGASIHAIDNTVAGDPSDRAA